MSEGTRLGCGAHLAHLRRIRSDPQRPLGAFLLMGPTGVGKTQCAKALAQVLFGTTERLLRFDMNEFLTGDAVARLIGTFREPEGLLTSAVRREPCLTGSIFGRQRACRT